MFDIHTIISELDECHQPQIITTNINNPPLVLIFAEGSADRATLKQSISLLNENAAQQPFDG